MEGSLRGHDVKWLALCRPGECAFADRARSQGRATGKRKERAAVSIYDTAEGARLRLNEQRVGHWNRWGPYLAERAWGTVREDYSADGCAWEYFTHDRGSTAGTKTDSAGSAIGASTSASPRPSGTAAIRFSKSGCSALRTPRAITAKTSRNIIITWTTRRATRTCASCTSIRRRRTRTSD